MTSFVRSARFEERFNPTRLLPNPRTQFRKDALDIMILSHEDGSPFELGRGAMGITYKAFDIDLQRLAALKVISPRYLADQGARSRFLREARAAGSVRHLNVASVFQLGASQKTISMPWSSWRERL